MIPDTIIKRKKTEPGSWWITEPVMYIFPNYPAGKPLAGVADDFVQSVFKKRILCPMRYLGKSVVRILEASQESIKNNGKEIRIK